MGRLVFCFIIAVSFLTNVFVCGKDAKGVYVEKESYCRTITKQQAIDRLMLAENITFTKAETIIENTRNGYKTNQERFDIYYMEFIMYHNFGANIIVETGCILIVSRDKSGHEIIRSILCEWAMADDTASYIWRGAYCISELQGTNKVYLRARGVIEVAVDKSLPESMNFRNELESVGFALSSFVGTKYYYYKIESWDTNYYHPFI
ncbi:hypothetical protein DFR58_11759 [Anaerobacterium chartisolvens]|uniref:Uncharacterized protein n=1 Tax=Anaerobacterium chartisolvens TaxID=1297424 RepID=A0A369AW30_9FIRM|nr:hypothetical protein [Anaerobacterium chartisolvens]RCX13519.1 hypothetical protein DFR58_11759 [Anaerobacterium chartisolvens]